MKKPNKTTAQAIEELEAGQGEHFDTVEDLLTDDAERQAYTETVTRSLTSADFERLLLKNAQLRAAIKRYKVKLDQAGQALVSPGVSVGKDLLEALGEVEKLKARLNAPVFGGDPFPEITVEMLVDKMKESANEIDKLKLAFHDAIRRPMGQVPDSGSEFYDPSRCGND